jgi:hypothetical protein
LLADPILIEQVLLNLMKNAAESVDSGAAPADNRSAWSSCVWRLDRSKARTAWSFQGTLTRQAGYCPKKCMAPTLSKPFTPPKPKAWASV